MAATAVAAPAHGATTSGRALIALQHRDQAGLLQFIAKVSDPKSPTYGQYLTSAQFRARYAPTDAAVAKVKAFAAASGLSIVDVPRNHAYVMVSGPLTILKQVLGSTAKLPSALRSLVTGITGLDPNDVAHPRATPPPAYVNAKPCSTSWADTAPAAGTPPVPGTSATAPAVPCGYTPQQLQGAYGTAPAIKAGLDGTGQTVAIIDAFSSPQIVADATEWSSRHGLPAPQITIHDNALQTNAPQQPSLPVDIPVVGGLLDPQGWAGEETLDVEAVHAMAPGAKIVFQGANSALNMDLEAAQNAVVDANEANVVSNSYGGSTDDTDSTSDGYWQQAAAQGMGVYFSSGDNGDETGGTGDTSLKSADAGANSPFVTAVGGSSIAIGPTNNYLFETYWGVKDQTLTNGAWSTDKTWAAGGGGGTSQVYGEPDYQKGHVPDSFANVWKGDANASSSAVIPGRVVPDVAMEADSNTGMLIGLQQDYTQFSNPLSIALPNDDTHYGEYRIGGTSLSSPLFAGVMALADQAAGKRHGLVNAALYGAASSAFHDISAPANPVYVTRVNYTNSTNDSDGTTTLLRSFGNLGSLKSVAGYDDSTGLGSPNGLAFLRALAPGSTLIPADPVAAKPTTTTTKKPAASCAKRKTYTLKAPKGSRVIRVTVKLGKKTVIKRHGRKLTKATITKPKKGTSKVTVTIVTSKHKTITKRYSLKACA